MKPLITVIVPVYNAETVLPSCLASLARQTYSHMEFLLIDDGSRDGSGCLCDAQAEADERFRVIHQQNAGVSVARNAGLEAARGEWVGFVDSDDTIEPDMYEYLYKLAEKHDCDIAQCAYFYEEDGQREVVAPNEPEEPFGGIGMISSRQWDGVFYTSWSKLFRRSSIGDIRFHTDLHVGEDLQFNLTVLQHGARIVLGREPKYHYVILKESLSHSTPKRADIENCRLWLGLLDSQFSDCGELTDRLKRDVLHMLLFLYARCEQSRQCDEEVKVELRREIMLRRLAMRGDAVYSRVDRIKAWLICKCPWLYRLILPIWKRMKRGGQENG